MRMFLDQMIPEADRPDGDALSGRGLAAPPARRAPTVDRTRHRARSGRDGDDGGGAAVRRA
ncbi:hypothetical protein AEQ27_13000 [Frigoribacterium sp. RIT-PI-h]|nr:hypothetical protein AEQ27_13000 [Frigoribacterium sp. RIT-PI-h]